MKPCSALEAQRHGWARQTAELARQLQDEAAILGLISPRSRFGHATGPAARRLARRLRETSAAVKRFRKVVVSLA